MINLSIVIAVGLCALVLSEPQVAGNGNRRRRNSKSKISKTSKCPSAKKSVTAKSTKGAVFTMTNDNDGNEIVVYMRNKRSGELTYTGSSFPTGGVGGDSTLEAPPDDPLASQNALVVADNCLLAVNAGSDTLTSFKIIEKRGMPALRKKSVVNSGGEIPVSIAYHNANGLVFALNAGGSGSISGFKLRKNCDLSPINSSESLNIGPRELLPPPNGPPYFVSSPAQIGFTPDGTEIFVTIKGIDRNPFFGGTINRFDVDCTTGLVSNLRSFETGINSIVPFSFDFDGDDNLLVVDAFGSSPPGTADKGSVTLYNVESNENAVSLDDNVNVVIGQTAVCWIKYSNGCAFTTNNQSNSISSLSVSNGSIDLIESIAASLNNPIDEIFSSDGKYLYVLSTGHAVDGQPRIYVYEVSENCGLNEIQIVEDGLPSEEDTTFGAAGMAIY